jgi:hypothetical protein
MGFMTKLSQTQAYEAIFKALNKGFTSKAARLEALFQVAKAIKAVELEPK